MKAKYNKDLPRIRTIYNTLACFKHVDNTGLQKIEKYLKDNGWYVHSTLTHVKAEVLHYKYKNDILEVILPQDSTISDTPARIHDIIEYLELITKRSQVDIFEEIMGYHR